MDPRVSIASATPRGTKHLVGQWKARGERVYFYKLLGSCEQWAAYHEQANIQDIGSILGPTCL